MTGILDKHKMIWTLYYLKKVGDGGPNGHWIYPGYNDSLTSHSVYDVLDDFFTKQNKTTTKKHLMDGPCNDDSSYARDRFALSDLDLWLLAPTGTCE